MKDLDKLLYGLFFIALVAVLLGSSQGAGLVSAVGSTIANLARNIVGGSPASSGAPNGTP